MSIRHWFSVWVLLGVLVAACTTVQAQGGQGGGIGGGGFGGGGMGGRALGNAEGEGDTFTKNHILTPGEHGEWPLKVEAGETIIARAQSTNFDPYLQVVTSTGQEVAANDDVRPGGQDALVRVTFAKAGDYKVLVKAFKQAGGGQYRFTLRRFTAAAVPFSTRVSGTMGRKSYKWYHFVAEKDQTLVVTVRSVSMNTALELIAPNGEPIGVDPDTVGGGRGVRFDYRARDKGTYFLRIGASGRPSEGFALTVAPARTLAIKIGETSPRVTVGPGGLDLWKFSGTPGEVIKVETRTTDAMVGQTVQYIDGKDETPAGGEPYPPLVPLPSSSKNSQVGITLLGRNGTYQVAVSQPLGLEASYTVTISRPLRAWNPASEVSSTLPVGSYDYYTLEGKPGQVVRLESSAEPFDVALLLFSPRGEQIARNDDGAGGRNALLTVLLSESGKYLVCVHSSGDGGGGAYRLKRVADPVHPLRIGEKSSGSVGSGTSDIWSFTGVAGQAILLSVRSSDFDVSVRVFGPDGVELASDDDGGDDTNSLLSTQLPVAGSYTVWVSPKGGSGKYSVRLLDVE